MGRPIVIDNKPGANSIVGVDALAKSPPDGYTFAVVIAAYAANITLYPKLPYDPKKDLAAVSLIGISPLVAAVNNDTPFKNAADLIDYARKNPGKVSYGSSGNGSAVNLTTELLKSMTQTSMVHIPYKGAAPALTDLMGGHIQLFMDAAVGLINPGKTGKVRLDRGCERNASRRPARRADLHRAGHQRFHGQHVGRNLGAGRHAAGCHQARR